MGAAVVYPHSALNWRKLPSFSALSRSKSGHSRFSIQEIPSRVCFSHVRADLNRRERPPQKNPSRGRVPTSEGSENAQSFDGRSQGSSSKEEILALFKRIQASISKGEILDSKKRSSNNAEAMSSAESVLEVLRQPRARRKGKTLGKKGDIFLAPKKDLQKKEQIIEQSSTKAGDFKSTRPPSSFIRRSPIPTPATPPPVQPESEPLPKLKPKSEPVATASSDIAQQSTNFESMKLPELKEVAKSKGIRGYSKLKKSELVELLIKS